MKIPALAALLVASFATFNAHPARAADSAVFSISDASVKEGNTGVNQLVFTVTLDATRAIQRSVDISLVGVTATQGVDFSNVGGTLVFAPGQQSTTFSVPIIGDTLSEANEVFFANLSNATDATIGKARGIGTILDNDPLPTLRISDTIVEEGNSEQNYAVFYVDLNAPSGQTVSFNYQTEAGGSPRATPFSDYAPLSVGTFSFAPGEVHKSLRVLIHDDTTPEKNEQFAMRLSNATGARITDGVALATIVDDDLKLPQISIYDASVVEGNSGKAYLVFKLKLDQASSQFITVKCTTTPGPLVPAKSGTDYVPFSNQIFAFAPGQRQLLVYVEVRPDKVVEPDETIQLVLSAPTNAIVVGGSGTGTIMDDDFPTFSIGGVNANEGDGTGVPNVLPFVITLSAARDFPVTVQYQTADGKIDPAKAGLDYVAIPKTSLTFAPGETSKEVDVKVIGDTLVEGNESVFLKLVSANNGIVSNTPGYGVILNDDKLPELQIGDAELKEGNSGLTAISFTVTLSKPSPDTVTVNYLTNNGSARAGSDYISGSGELTFLPGQTTQTVTIQIKGDTAVEGDEDFYAVISDAVGADIVKAKGHGVIHDDDAVTTTASGASS